VPGNRDDATVGRFFQKRAELIFQLSGGENRNIKYSTLAVSKFQHRRSDHYARFIVPGKCLEPTRLWVFYLH
jgi:hypothetical protein